MFCVLMRHASVTLYACMRVVWCSLAEELLVRTFNYVVAARMSMIHVA
jgi:hypothetical protein